MTDNADAETHTPPFTQKEIRALVEMVEAIEPGDKVARMQHAIE